jgi:hypothetical protein
MECTTTKPDASSLYLAEQRQYGERCRGAAIDYLENRGWSIVPVCHYAHVGCGRAHGRRCANPGRGPLVNTSEFAVRRPSRREIDQWWCDWPLSGLAAVLGPASNLVAVQVEGDAAEAKLAELAGPEGLPETAVVLGPRGRVMLFALPEGSPAHTHEVPVAGGTLKLLGVGELVVLPPSKLDAGLVIWG